MSDLLPGTEVEARGLRWEVVFSQAAGQQTLYRLRGLEGAVRGRELDLLAPFEEIRPKNRGFEPERAAPLAHWLVYHRAFLLEQALGPHSLLAVQPGRLRVEPYQLVPVLRALRMSRPRLLLADAVGLGKTIQAGLVLTELMARRLAHRVLIVSPAGPLLQQWITEMLDRFGLRLDEIDRARLEEIRRGHELGANPFDHVHLGIASIDFLKQEKVLTLLDRDHAPFDVVIIDEAHHCFDLSGALERSEDTQRRRLAEVLARQCDSMLLLTATPHDGNDRSFASLCELLDPSLVDGRGELRGQAYRGHVIRRLKRHIKDKDGTDRFRERKVDPRPVVPESPRHDAFLAMHRSLLALVAPELRRAFGAKRYSDVLAFIALLKRSVSTVAACGATLEAVSDRFSAALTEGAESQEARSQRRKSLREYARSLDRFGVLGAEAETDVHRLEAEEVAQRLAELERDHRTGARDVKRIASVVDSLAELRDLATDAAARDPKLEQLVAEIRNIRAVEPGANVLVYSEYVDSQRVAARTIAEAGLGEVLTMSGEDDNPSRQATTERFRLHDGLVLVSTDAAAEGLNLHQRCHHLIHLELPFNPNRLEQRNGRIDRYGQTRDPIVRYLYLRGTFEERILLKLIAKYERQRKRLTFVPNTLGLATSTDAGAARLLKGLMAEETELFRDTSPAVEFFAADEPEASNEATQELLEEIDRSLRSFEDAARTHTWLGDAGLNAEAQLATEADQALRSGTDLAHVDLPRFVVDACVADGGEVQGALTDQTFEVRLPPSWLGPVEDLPGWDAATRSLCLTTHLDVIHDPQNRPAGYLGRAHPLVRRALDRVRNLSFGQSAAKGEDPRVSAIAAPVPTERLLLTYLARVSSPAGRELERVLAVEVSRADDGTVVHASADSWLGLIKSGRAVSTRDLWKTRFATWAEPRSPNALSAATAAFEPIARAFCDERRKAIVTEIEDLDRWLRQRSADITQEYRPTQQQLDLTAGTTATQPEAAPTWASLSDPIERLAGFAKDREQPAKKRSEAQGVLTLHAKRRADLGTRLGTLPPEIVPLGLLMIVPAS